ncbi:MAG: PHP domain-containing protein [Chloroflexi bacterium]|nr:PHP domain-containing protein [Chloroflexota bacterium]
MAERPIEPPVPATIDLHTHTTRSDGLLAPAELVRRVYEAGVRTLAITDHDSLAGVREVSASIPNGLALIPGVEINAVGAAGRGGAGGEVHVLGLGVDPDDEAFEALLANQRRARRERYDEMVRRLAELGLDLQAELDAMPATVDEDALGRPRIARAMIARGVADSIDDAFDRWLSPGRPAYVPRAGLGPLEAITAIRAAGGLPALAHYWSAPDRMSVLRELRDEGLAGLEVHHRSFDAPTVAVMAEIARGLGFVATGGSDYHGDAGPYAEAHAGLWVPDEIGPPLLAALGRG